MRLLLTRFTFIPMYGQNQMYIQLRSLETACKRQRGVSSRAKEGSLYSSQLLSIIPFTNPTKCFYRFAGPALQAVHG